ncbi:MAG: hypothetical protein PSV35_03780 [bacterium]|nr:hypothetical protein [bacterium]
MLNLTGNINVGYGGTGSLIISDSGKINSIGTTEIGVETYTNSGIGSILITGAGSQWNRTSL